ncbi:MAG: hypothetical protein WCA37_00480 [Terracidiphilus sp.]
MSLLRQDSNNQLDDAARGESFTRGTSHLIWASIAATIVVTVAITIYVIAGEKPPAATGEILDIWAHPMHTESSGFDANGAPIPKESFDQVLVFAHVRLHNQSKQPLFLYQILSNATLADGIHSSYAATASDYRRIFVAYPDLTPWRAEPLPLETTIEPGQTVEGTFVSSFRLSKADWDARKGLNFSFGFRYLPALTLTAQVPVTER